MQPAEEAQVSPRNRAFGWSGHQRSQNQEIHVCKVIIILSLYCPHYFKFIRRRSRVVNLWLKKVGDHISRIHFFKGHVHSSILIRSLIRIKTFFNIYCSYWPVDICLCFFRHGLAPISTDYLQPSFDWLSIELYKGSVTQRDSRFKGFDLATAIEV